MRILYGVVGEGMGHAMRSRVILDRLTQSHDVQVMVSNRAYEFLRKRFAGVNRIWGLTLAYEDNEVQKRLTLLENATAALTGLPENIASYFELLQKFQPELVISDFESWTYFYGKAHRLPIIDVDNMQIINRCQHDPALVRGHERELQLTKALIKSKLPFCSHYVISTFFYPPVRKGRTTLVPPILRPEIIAARSQVRRGDHLLVYQTSDMNAGLADVLHATGLECRIYGVRRQITEEQVEGNLRYRPFSEAGFIEDLATSRGVVAGGGFTLMGEAVYLRKPMLSVPVAGQFEQVINGLYLEQLGYGQMAAELDVDVVKRFVAAIPACEDALSHYDQPGNDRVFEVLDELLARAAAGLLNTVGRQAEIEEA
jgi:uncharacterized protein (TIGR00661 family)